MRALAVALALLGCGLARADDAGPRVRVPLFAYFGSDPLKVLLLSGVHLRDVYRSDPSPVLDGAYLDGGVDLLLNPSTPGARAHLEWMPIAPVILKLDHCVHWYTAFPRGSGHGLSFPSADDDFGPGVLEARGGEEERLVAQRSMATLVLRARLWRVSAQSESELAGWYVPAGRGSAWYEMAYDLLIKRGEYDLTFMNRSVLLFEVWRSEPGWSLSLGALNEYVRAVGTAQERDRVGGMVMLSPGASLLGAQAPSLVLMLGGTALHPSRVGHFWANVAVSGAWEVWRPGR